MSNSIRFGEALQVLPVLAPIAAITNDAASVTSFVDLSLAHWCTFAIQFGVTSATDTGLITIHVEGSTSGADTDSEVDVPFTYRITHTIGGAPSCTTETAVGSTSTTVASTDVTSAVLLIDVDPAAVAKEGCRYVRFSMDPAADSTSYFRAAVAYLEPRYPGAALPSNFTST